MPTVPEAAVIPLAMLIVFGSAKLLAELFEKAGQPGIVGEILAGVLVGPSVLNWIQPSSFLTALADLGVTFLLFRVGLEIDLNDLVKVGKTALLSAVLGVILPFIMGWSIMRLWGDAQAESLFVGAAMVATSVGITAQVLASKKMLNHRASQVILAAAVIDDVLGLIILAVVSSVTRGEVKVLELLSAAALAIGFTVVVAVWGTKAVTKVVPVMQEKLGAGEVQFNLAMVLLFGMFVLAVMSGVAGIIGAFLAGMALSPVVTPRVHDLTQGVTELLVPFFLAGIGLHLNLAVYADSGVLLLCAVILIAAIVSKMLGCGLGAFSLGRKDALRIGVGMVPRGEVGMVVAQIGISAGVVSNRVYAVVVLMAVVTTIVTPPMLKSAFRGAETT